MSSGSDNQPPKPDLDLIAMVQKARMLHDAEAKPSEISAVYWIEAKNLNNPTITPTPRSGEWVIETTAAEVDTLWTKIKAATEAGHLGYKSRVATASRSGHPDQRVICIRTYDSQDQADVERIRAALIALGLPDNPHYATD